MASWHGRNRFADGLIGEVKPLPTEPDMAVSEADDLYWRFWVVDLRYKLIEKLGEDGADALTGKLRSFPPHASQKEYYQQLQTIAVRLASDEAYRETLEERPGAWPTGSW